MRDYIGGNNLFIPSFSWEFPVTEERSSDFAVGAIAADDIVRRQSLLAFGSLASNTGLLLILIDADDFMRPENLGSGAFCEMLDENLAELVQWQTDHRIWTVLGDRHIDSSKPCAVKFSPANTVGDESAGTHVLEHTGLA